MATAASRSTARPAASSGTVGAVSAKRAGVAAASPCRPCHAAPPRRARAAALCRARRVGWDAPSSDVPEHDPALKPAAAKQQPSVKHYDYLVIGSGIAGLTYALKVAQYGRVALVTKEQANEGCTQYAQGGVCAVLDATDSVADHVQDTVVAGAFLNDLRAVEAVCREGPARVLELVQLGADFTRNPDGSLHLTKEGGHNNRRIVHAADLTGREIERALLAQARANTNVDIFEHHLAIDLVVADHAGVPHCFGADVLDQRSMTMTRFVSLGTMLASGGAGQVYPNTTNPHVATGDGIAMAYRADSMIANMEFIQFHPTALYTGGAAAAAAAAMGGAGSQTFLITEALRGEGAVLRNLAGERFMEQYDPTRMELAPRDVVARAIHDQLRTRNEPHVWLDISHKPAHEILEHFPNIAARCAQQGIDITRDPIPVVPAQHYTCGGVQTGLLGETNIQGLYACGEVACSGLHGANRLASNSLLEGLVFADRAVNPSVAHAEHAAQHCRAQLRAVALAAPVNGRSARRASAGVAAWAAARRQELRDVMWRHCGIVRRTGELRAALDHVMALSVEARSVFANGGVCTPVVELLNLVTCAELIITCALQRKESRGLHYVLEYPKPVERERRSSVISLSQRRTYELVPPLLTGGKAAGAPVAGGLLLGGALLPAGGSAAAAKKKRGAGRGEVAVRSAPEEQ